MNFKLGEKLFEESRYQEAFEIFKQIGEDKAQSDVDRAEAYNMMGVLITYCPDLSKNEDESGLEYYKIALQFNKGTLSALLNIVSFFGEEPDSHQDIQAFKSAYTSLMDYRSELNDENLKTLKEKYLLMQKLEQGE